MRYVTGSITNAAAYVASFFYQPATTEECVLDICAAAFFLDGQWRYDIEKQCPSLREDEATLENYLREKRYKKDGYTRVRLMNFDFNHEESLEESKRKYTQLFTLISGEITLCQAVLSAHQLRLLLWNDVDLSRSSYAVPGGVSLEEYVACYEYRASSHALASLHDVTVHCEEADLRQCPDNFLAVCKSAWLKGALITQWQLGDLLSAFPRKKNLNLKGLVLRDLDISRLLKEFDDFIDFSDKPYQQEKCICLADTSIEGASIDICVLANLKSKYKYAHWFNATDKIFKICYEEGLEEIEVPISVDKFLEDVKRKLPSTGLKSLFGDKLVAHLNNQYRKNNNAFDDFAKMSLGEKFLWVCHCANQYPDSAISHAFWKVVKPLDPFKMLESLQTSRR